MEIDKGVFCVNDYKEMGIAMQLWKLKNENSYRRYGRFRTIII